MPLIVPLMKFYTKKACMKNNMFIIENIDKCRSSDVSKRIHMQ